MIRQIPLACAALLISWFTSTAAIAQPDFVEYLSALKTEALERGHDKTVVETAFANVSYLTRAVKADRNQPEFVLTLDTYLPRALPEWKLQRATKLYKQHQHLLERIAAEYGVQARFIVALWGVESNFGKLQGKLPLMSTLSTLAFDGRREAFFKKQLFAALTMLEQGHVSQEALKGSWAGATGQTQFIPTSFLNYAQDYDGDGKKDIWNTPEDVFASIANYLKSEGWQGDQTWGRQVQLPTGFDQSLTGLAKDKRRLIADWQGRGVRRLQGQDLPSRALAANVLLPDDIRGRAYLVYHNFSTLMRWNRSLYFGVTVGTFADQLGWRLKSE